MLRQYALTPPHPERGWSREILDLDHPVVMPPVIGDFVQEAGVLRSDGTDCPRAALWRNHRPLTIPPPAPTDAAAHLDGTWLWGGVLWVHFGHFLVESTSRLWALDHLPADVQGIVFIPKRPHAGDMVVGFQRDFVDLMQARLPVKVLTEPTRVHRLIVPGQGFGLGKIISGTEEFRAAINRRFGADVPADGPEKLYISRSRLGLSKGSLIGENRLEEYLSAQGYEIFHPQAHDLRTQVARYKAARHVIAAEGSAIHLFAMVGKPDQKMSIIVRRRSGATDQIETHLRSFCGIDPLTLDHLRATWRPDNNAKKRHWLGELDLPAVQTSLIEGGYIQDGEEWEPLTESEVVEFVGPKFMRVETETDPTPQPILPQYGTA